MNKEEWKFLHLNIIIIKEFTNIKIKQILTNLVIKSLILKSLIGMAIKIIDNLIFIIKIIMTDNKNGQKMIRK